MIHFHSVPVSSAVRSCLNSHLSTDKTYCCKRFQHMVETGELKDYEGDGKQYYRLCQDCYRHNGYPEIYCSNCGKKL